jgi:hypothetical protein
MPDVIHHIEIIGTGMRTLGISTVSDVRACSSVASTGDAATSAKAVDYLSYREFTAPIWVTESQQVSIGESQRYAGPVVQLPIWCCSPLVSISDRTEAHACSCVLSTTGTGCPLATHMAVGSGRKVSR